MSGCHSLILLCRPLARRSQGVITREEFLAALMRDTGSGKNQGHRLTRDQAEGLFDEADVDLGCIFDCDWVQGDDVNVCVSFDSEEDCSSDCTEDVVDWLTEACTAGYNCLADCAWLQYSYSYDLCEHYDPDEWEVETDYEEWDDAGFPFVS